MAPPSRTRYSLPLSQYFQLGGFHNPLVLLHQRAENDSQRKLTSLVTWTTALSSSLKLWAMPCRVTQDRQVMVVWSHKMWSTGEGMANYFSILALRKTWKSMKRQKDRTLEDELSRSVCIQCATGDQWRNSSRKNEDIEPKKKNTPNCGCD